MFQKNKNSNLNFNNSDYKVNSYKQSKDEKETAIFIGISFFLICVVGFYFNF